jgi:hypothetical protein
MKNFAERSFTRCVKVAIYSCEYATGAASAPSKTSDCCRDLRRSHGKVASEQLRKTACAVQAFFYSSACTTLLHMFWLTSWRGWAIVVAGIGWLVNAIALPTPWDALSWLLCALLFVYGMFGGAELLRCVLAVRAALCVWHARRSRASQVRSCEGTVQLSLSIACLVRKRSDCAHYSGPQSYR